MFGWRKTLPRHSRESGTPACAGVTVCPPLATAPPHADRDRRGGLFGDDGGGRGEARLPRGPGEPGREKGAVRGGGGLFDGERVAFAQRPGAEHERLCRFARPFFRLAGTRGTG